VEEVGVGFAIGSIEADVEQRIATASSSRKCAGRRNNIA
jgi:hypothetical protein